MTTPTALITGGSSGIGLAVSNLLIERGYRVFSVSRNPNRVEISSQFIPVEFDLLEIEKIAEFSTEFIRNNGVPDLLINNAGCGAFYDWEHFPEEEITKQINLLFTSPILLCKHIAPEMAKAGKGTILNLSSLATLYPLPFMPLYNAGKSALSSYTESMMFEYHESPKFIDFRMGDVKTKFNQVASAQPLENQSSKMKKAWSRIDWQLERSPPPKTAALQIIRSLDKGKSGRVYGGSFFHRVILPIIYPNVMPRLLISILKRYYSLY
jgi:short-subunit dehydrogenase